jgi:hypothetical protein
MSQSVPARDDDFFSQSRHRLKKHFRYQKCISNFYGHLRLNRGPLGLTEPNGPRCRISPCKESGMQDSREDFETLRLLRAFRKIQDPEKRRAIIEIVEIKADPSSEGSDDERSIPPG